MKFSEVLEEAIKHYGEEAQKRKAVEELLELGQAILKDMATGKNLEQIYEEFADVEIMLSQVQLMYNLSNDKINDLKEYKINRLYEGIKKVKQKKIYLAGPMTGISELNFPEFHKVAAEIRAKGFNVVSPAEIVPKADTWEGAMKQDIKALMDCDIIAVMKGWESSKGTTIEVFLANQMGIRIVDAEFLEDIEIKKAYNVIVR